MAIIERDSSRFPGYKVEQLYWQLRRGLKKIYGTILE
jgi:hypothetical protein